jgi:hypothetical protein
VAQTHPADPRAQAGDRPEAQLVAQISEQLREHDDRFPALAATMTSAATEGPQEQAFTFGLDRIRDGLRLLIAQRREPPADGQPNPGGQAGQVATWGLARLGAGMGGWPQSTRPLSSLRYVSERCRCAPQPYAASSRSACSEREPGSAV